MGESQCCGAKEETISLGFVLCMIRLNIPKYSYHRFFSTNTHDETV